MPANTPCGDSVEDVARETVLFYESEHYYLSNFSSFAVYMEGVVWMTVEHAYQASKFDEESIRAQIRNALSAHDAKKIAKSHGYAVRSDWSRVKLQVMEELLRAKLSLHPFVRKKLLETGNACLVEDSPKDSFWGRGSDWTGENHLGKLWEKLREELRARIASKS